MRSNRQSGRGIPDDSCRLLAGVLAVGLAANGKSGVDAATGAGRSWGRELVQRDDAHSAADPVPPALRIVEILDEVGFSPKLRAPETGSDVGSDPGHTVIELHRCPFLDVATENSDVVCSVHRGLMDGALARLHSPMVTLDPFARPGVCLAHLTGQATTW